MQKLINSFNIKHFKATELLLASNTVPPKDLWLNIIPTLLIADQCRDDLGFAIRITSAYRDKEYNKRTQGSSSKSLHIIFNALDIMPYSGRMDEIKLLHEWFGNFKCCANNNICREVMGVGYYHNRVHLDTRGLHGRKKSEWDYR